MPEENLNKDAERQSDVETTEKLEKAERELEKEISDFGTEIKRQIAEEEKSTDDDKPVSLNDDTTRKVIFSLCYLWGILFFLPLILYKGDARAVRHANEGLLLFILSVVGNVVFGVLTRFGWFFGLIAVLYSLALLLLGIVGIVYVVTDRDKPLPIIGGIKLLK